MQEGDSVKDAVEGVPTAQPCIVVRGTLNAIKDTVLVLERKAVTTFPPNDTPLVLLGAFYAYNMHYTEGCKNFYSFLEVVFLKCKNSQKRLGLQPFLPSLVLVTEHTPYPNGVTSAVQYIAVYTLGYSIVFLVYSLFCIAV